MNVGMIFFAIAAVILFLGGVGVTALPNPLLWGTFCIALGLLLRDVAVPRRAGWRR